jgi:hypothetical protein
VEKQGGDPTAIFWEIAERFLLEADIGEGTVMGFPCLRLNGGFLACAQHRSGDLIVKLPEKRVQELIDCGQGQAFAPAGRKFKQWVQVGGCDARRWRLLIKAARDFSRAADISMSSR